MTLGEFREATMGMSDDLNLEFYSERYNDSTLPIKLEFDTQGYIEFIIDDDRWNFQPAPKWTRVEDGLPETHEDSRFIHRERSDEVMCKIKADEDVINSCGYLIEHADGHKEWQTDCYMSDDDEVIAWMPFPKYEGVE